MEPHPAKLPHRLQQPSPDVRTSLRDRQVEEIVAISKIICKPLNIVIIMNNYTLFKRLRNIFVEASAIVFANYLFCEHPTPEGRSPWHIAIALVLLILTVPFLTVHLGILLVQLKEKPLQLLKSLIDEES